MQASFNEKSIATHMTNVSQVIYTDYCFFLIIFISNELSTVKFITHAIVFYRGDTGCGVQEKHEPKLNLRIVRSNLPTQPLVEPESCGRKLEYGLVHGRIMHAHKWDEPHTPVVDGGPWA